MKFVHFTSAGYPNGTYGLVGSDGTIEVLAGGLLDPVQKTGKTIKESEIVRYLPPLFPPNILAMACNYYEHCAENREATPPVPLLFIKASTCISGHLDDIVLPKIAPEHVDWEAEMCVIIGKKARHVSEEDALDYVFGYTCGNDVSARDCQAAESQWARAKSFDSFGPMGPYVVTDIDPSKLRIQMRLNGTTMQDDTNEGMVYNVPTLISHLSKCMTLLPGTIIMAGTPGGVGNARRPPILLKPGDVCEVEIENIGTLKNTCRLEE